MMALAYLAIFAGALVLIAGLSGSTVTSVAKGAPDKAKAPAPSAGTGLTGGVEAGAPTSAPGKIGGVLRAASTQLGVPYRWGGELARIEFDCSGLVQWSARQAGIKLPRTAAEQYGATQHLSPSEAGPGDLVFFSNGREISHVGIVVRPGVMIDAPHTGANVRYESFPTQIGAAWGSDHVAGYGRP
jgi:cell wall-associated NlpC family hydrolase